MECITYNESEAWFAAMGVKIVKHRYISFSQRAVKRRCIFVSNLEIEASNLGHLCTQLIDWLPNGCKRMLWLRDWATYRPDPTLLFETIRRGCGENRHIIDAPGHLFEASAYDRRGYGNRAAHDHEANNLWCGVLFCIIAFHLLDYPTAPNAHSP